MRATTTRPQLVRKRAAALGAATLACAAAQLFGPAPTAHAESGGANGDELIYCFLTFSCATVEDATTWASETASWYYRDSLHNGRGDAFRHCLWAGALANRLGYTDAFTQVMVHEDLDNDPMSEVIMDVTNDQIGLDLGVRSSTEGGDDTWGWILAECAARADGGELAGMDGVLGSY